jgi:hypothetical protein
MQETAKFRSLPDYRASRKSGKTKAFITKPRHMTTDCHARSAPHHAGGPCAEKVALKRSLPPPPRSSVRGHTPASVHVVTARLSGRPPWRLAKKPRTPVLPRRGISALRRTPDVFRRSVSTLRRGSAILRGESVPHRRISAILCGESVPRRRISAASCRMPRTFRRISAALRIHPATRRRISADGRRAPAIRCRASAGPSRPSALRPRPAARATPDSRPDS